MREVTTKARHIGNVSYEFHPAATAITRLDVDGERTFEKLGPGSPSTTMRGLFVTKAL